MRRSALKFAVIVAAAVVVVCGSDDEGKSLDGDIDFQRVEISESLSCQYASLRCSYRAGCGRTLQSYVLECSDLVSNHTNDCPERCKNTLVGLASTPEGRRLMNCACDEDDLDCKDAKSRVAPACRAPVLSATRAGANVSCAEAEWICLADAECAKALEYYESYCKAVFKGRRCSSRCRNSIDILRRQRQASKLEDCDCEADRGCEDIKTNIKSLCYKEAEKEVEGNDLNKNLGDDDEDVASKATFISEHYLYKSLTVIVLINFA